MLNTDAIHKAINTPLVKDLVSSYLLARAYYEVTRDAVDAIYEVILQEIPLYANQPFTHRTGDHGLRITRVKDMYLSLDEDICAEIYYEAHIRLIKAGIKPKDMPQDNCPALVAESMLSNIRHELVTETGKDLDVTVNKLLCGHDGLNRLQQWVDLVCKAVMSMPDFEPPKLPGRSP